MKTKKNEDKLFYSNLNIMILLRTPGHYEIEGNEIADEHLREISSTGKNIQKLLYHRVLLRSKRPKNKEMRTDNPLEKKEKK